MALRSAGFCLDTGGELTAQMGNIEKSGAAHRHGWEGKQVKNSILKFLKRIALAAVAICLLLCLFLTGILVYGSARRYVIKKIRSTRFMRNMPRLWKHRKRIAAGAFSVTY